MDGVRSGCSRRREHVLCASCDPEALGYDETGKMVDPGAAPALIDHYYSELCTALAANGAAASVEEAAATWTREEVQKQYEAAVMDMCRVVFGYQWVRVKASPETLAANFDSMNRNSYNRASQMPCGSCKSVMRCSRSAPPRKCRDLILVSCRLRLLLSPIRHRRNREHRRRRHTRVRSGYATWIRAR